MKKRYFWRNLIGKTRLSVTARLLAVAIAMAHADAGATIMNVGTTADLFSASDSNCSLREALYAATQHMAFGGCPAGTGGDTILLAGTYTITRLPVAGHPEQGGAFYIGSHAGDILAIAPFEQNSVILDANGVDSVLNVVPGAGTTLIIGGMTLRNGVVSLGECGAGGMSFGCGQNVPDAQLNMSNMWITANSDFGLRADGGMIALTRVSVTDNKNTGIVLSHTGVSSFDDVTVSRNVAGGGGRNLYGPGGVQVDNTVGALSVNNSTIAYNTFRSDDASHYTIASAGGIGSSGDITPIVYLRNTLIANNARGNRTAGGDCGGLFQSQGYNLIGDPVCDLEGVATGNLIGIDPQLAPLFDYGSGRPTHLLLPGSPAIAAGNPATPGSGSACARYDGRNLDRTAIGGARCDIGAYQTHADSIVNTQLDAVDANTGDGVCATSSHLCSLRAAVMTANNATTFQTIQLPAGHFMITLPPTLNPYFNQGGTFSLTGFYPVTIIGAGPDKTIIDGNALDRVFTSIGFAVEPAPTVSLHNLTVTNGADVNTETGGGGIQTSGALLLDHIVASANRSPIGGGLFVTSGASATIWNSSIVDNNADNGTAAIGGGIYAEYFSSVDINNSTIGRNVSAGIGGGLAVTSNAQMSLSFVTVADNRAATGGGGLDRDGSGNFSLANSIIANNADASGQGADCLASIQVFSAVLLENATGCTIGGPFPAGLTNTDPKLSSLAVQGGAVPTFGLTVLSPNAIQIGLPSQCVDIHGVALLVDERVQPRPTAQYGPPTAECNLGAFQGISDIIFADGFE